MFNKGLDKNDKKEGLFKRLENVEGKIKSENKKESEKNFLKSLARMKKRLIIMIFFLK